MIFNLNFSAAFRDFLVVDCRLQFIEREICHHKLIKRFMHGFSISQFKCHEI